MLVTHSKNAEMPSPMAKKSCHFPQGHSALTILTNIGDHLPVISRYEGYSRSKTVCPLMLKKGSRPMHRTTLTFERTPEISEFTTSSKLAYGGGKHLERGIRPQPFPSLHESHIKFGSRKINAFDTHYDKTYFEKEIIPANRLHLVSIENGVNQTDGAAMRRVHKYPDLKPTYWSQYDRIHSTLGRMLGPGAPRERPVRQMFNALTGEHKGPAWQEENKRTSGNRVLSAARDDKSGFVLG